MRQEVSSAVYVSINIGCRQKYERNRPSNCLPAGLAPGDIPAVSCYYGFHAGAEPSEFLQPPA